MFEFYSIQLFHVQTNFVINEIYLDDIVDSDLPEFILRSKRDVEKNQSIILDPFLVDDCDFIQQKLGRYDNLPARLVHAASRLPYRTHGGREFDLMMKGIKPLCVFSHVPSSSTVRSFLSEYFEPQVKNGKMIQAELQHGDDSEEGIASTILFVLQGEEWRIPAYKMMLEAWKIDNWNDSLEFIEGYLLGYTLDQFNYNQSYRRKNGLKWGLQKFYKYASEAEVAAIENNFWKSLIPIEVESVLIFLPQGVYVDATAKLAMKTADKKLVVSFYAPRLKLANFSNGYTKINDIEFETFLVRTEEFIFLNSIIVDNIEIV